MRAKFTTPPQAEVLDTDIDSLPTSNNMSNSISADMDMHDVLIAQQMRSRSPPDAQVFEMESLPGDMDPASPQSAHSPYICPYPELDDDNDHDGFDGFHEETELYIAYRDRSIEARDQYYQDSGQQDLSGFAHSPSTPNFRSIVRHPDFNTTPYSLKYPEFPREMHHQPPELLPANSRQQLSPNALTYQTPSTSPYDNLHLVASEMNAIYERGDAFDQVRDFQGQVQDHHQVDESRYPSPPPPMSNDPYAQQQQPPHQQQQAASPDSRVEGQAEGKSDSEASSPGRSKSVAKPERPVTKTPDGRYECSWPDCTEELKVFTRKCEWSKHMDKHERPYKCTATGCEKLPGFTYSGGLLRHEREVHSKHGGPRKHLNCPHPNCKRHDGKGFSRQENLNEHLRRVHTSAGPTAGSDGQVIGGGGGINEIPDQGIELLQQQPSLKRKRGPADDDSDIREENKRLRQEIDQLRMELAQQESTQADMQRQLHHLQAAMHMQQPRIQAPPATMV